MGLKSGEFAGQLETGMPWSLNQVLLVLALCSGVKSCWKICISIKLVSSRKHEVLQNFLVDGCADLGTQWINTSRWPGTPNHHWLWKRYTRPQAMWFCASPLFLQIDFQSTCNIAFHQRTLEHSAAVQSFLSLTQARHFWCFFLFKSGLTPGIQQLKPMSCIRLHGGSWSSDSSCSLLFVTLAHIFDGFCSTIHSRVACTLSYHIFSFPSSLY